MTKTKQNAAPIRAELDAARERLAQLEERHEAAMGREAEARRERAAKLAEGADRYRPELAAAVDAAAAEREALSEAIETVRANVADAEHRLEVAENAGAVSERDRLKAAAVAAWEALDAELMKLAPRILQLHDEALAARSAHGSAAMQLGNNWPYIPTPPGVAYAMGHAREYLSGEAAANAEKKRARREREEEAEALRTRQRR